MYTHSYTQYSFLYADTHAVHYIKLLIITVYVIRLVLCIMASLQFCIPSNSYTSWYVVLLWL